MTQNDLDKMLLGLAYGGPVNLQDLAEAFRLAKRGLEIKAKECAAVTTLESKGYTWNGGEMWKPVVGDAKQTLSLLDELAKLRGLLVELSEAAQPVGVIAFQHMTKMDQKNVANNYGRYINTLDIVREKVAAALREPDCCAASGAGHSFKTERIPSEFINGVEGGPATEVEQCQYCGAQQGKSE